MESSGLGGTYTVISQGKAIPTQDETTFRVPESLKSCFSPSGITVSRTNTGKEGESERQLQKGDFGREGVSM